MKSYAPGISTFFGLVLLCTTSSLNERVKLNGTRSLPRGVWWAHPVTSRVDAPSDTVWIALTPPELALDLGCVREEQVLLKQVLAWPGEVVCREGLELYLAAHPSHRIPTADHTSEGLPNAPFFSGCIEIGPGELFVVGQHPSSCDSRYFGPVLTSQVVAEVHPLLVIDPLRSMRPGEGESHP